MRYFALATDYDGTIAHHGKVNEATADAIQRLREAGCQCILVTGRVMPELLKDCTCIEQFDRIVAENGALLYDPATKAQKLLCEAPPEEFVDRMRSLVPAPLEVGEAIVATWEPFQHEALRAIQELGLELQVIFNKGAVMVLPTGVNKATGLHAALYELGLSAHNVVGVGDAENDHAFLAYCECAVAVANAVPALKERADLVTKCDHGAGVIELIDRMMKTDLGDLSPRLSRHDILIGKGEDGAEELFDPFGVNLLVAGSSSGGKTTLTSGLMERLAAAEFQFVAIDPEGDYAGFADAVQLGDTTRAPLIDEVLDLAADPGQSVLVNLLGVPLDRRPAFFAELMPRLQSMRSLSGRPHWIVVDEAHHLLHAHSKVAELALPATTSGLMFVTVHPDVMAPDALKLVNTMLAVGDKPEETLARFWKASGRSCLSVEPTKLDRGEALLWRTGKDNVVKVKTEPPTHEHQRHSRKYAAGNLGQDRSFYFRGPDKKLNLRASNLFLFLQIADGVDDETWQHHLQNGDYSEWFRVNIKDDDLSAAAEQIEQDSSLSPEESRSAIRDAVESRYTLPVDQPTGQP